MSAAKQPVFLYRFARANATQLRDLLVALFPGGGWSYGGAAIWGTPEGVAHLRRIARFTHAADVELGGDFGHAFDADLEVRWKRLDRTVYDLLALAERKLVHPSLTPLEHRLTYQPAGNAELSAALQNQSRSPLHFRPYYGPGGGVVLVRYTGLEKR